MALDSSELSVEPGNLAWSTVSHENFPAALVDGRADQLGSTQWPAHLECGRGFDPRSAAVCGFRTIRSRDWPVRDRQFLDFERRNDEDVSVCVFALDPTLSNPTFNAFGFSLYAQKTIEPGGSGGAGSVSIAAFDDLNAELVGGVNISGSLNSNPHGIAVPGQVATTWSMLAIDPNAPPNNNRAQVILGQFICNSGTVQFFTTAIPEPTGAWLQLLSTTIVLGQRRRR